MNDSTVERLRPWHREGDESLPYRVAEHVCDVVNRQRWVYENMFNLLDMYLGCSGKGRERYVRTFSDVYRVRQMAKWNVARQNVDTLQNHLASAQVRPMVASSGGKWEMRLRAKKLEKYLVGVFYNADAYAIIQDAFLMADVCNIGYVLPYHCDDSGDIMLEGILPWEIVVDEEAAYLAGGHRFVREAFRVRELPREDLIEQFPDFEDELVNHPASCSTIHGETVRQDCIRVYECWRKARGGAKGLDAICTDSLLLSREDAKERYFPFVEVRWKPRAGHWIGMGAMEEIYSLQREIDREMQRLQSAHDMHGDPRVLVDVQAKVNEADLELAEEGMIVHWDSSEGGQPPKLVVDRPLAPEFYMYIDRTAQRLGEELGNSQLSNQGVRPAGNDISGFAYEVIDDIEGRRHTRRSQVAYEYPVEIGRRIIRLSKDVYGKSKKVVKWQEKGLMESIDWAEAWMEDDEFQLRYYPASIFPDHPKGRLQTAEKLLETGLATPQEIRAEIYSPELEIMRELDNAPVDCAHMAVNAMLYEGRYVSPSKYLGVDGLNIGVKIVNLSLIKSEAIDGAPPERVALLQRWLDAADLLLKQLAMEAMQEEAEMAAMGPQQPGPQVPPGASPEEALAQEQPAI